MLLEVVVAVVDDIVGVELEEGKGAEEEGRSREVVWRELKESGGVEAESAFDEYDWAKAGGPDGSGFALVEICS